MENCPGKPPDSHDISHELKTNYCYVKPLRFQSSGVTMAEPNILILRQHGRLEARKRTNKPKEIRRKEFKN